MQSRKGQSKKGKSEDYPSTVMKRKFVSHKPENIPFPLTAQSTTNKLPCLFVEDAGKQAEDTALSAEIRK